MTEIPEAKKRIRKTYRERKMSVKPRVQEALNNGDIEGVIDNLTPRQRSFAIEYVKDFNAAAAARRAGYQGEYMNRQGYELLTHPGVRAAVDLLLRERSDSIDVDANYVIRKLVHTLERSERSDNYNPTAVLRAAELLAKHLGMFVERTEITGKDGEAIKYEKVQEDADAFTRAIAGLAKRGREDGVAEQTQH
jgi:phage terminase small subunit